MPLANTSVLLHGFTQTPRSWGRFGQLLAVRGAVERPWLPGHGPDPTPSTDLWGAADALAPDRPSTIIGYSMGGRVALHMALNNPGRVSELVVLSATAGIVDPAERRRRVSEDEALADRIETIGVDAFLAEWLARDMFASLPDDPSRWEDRRDNTSAGLAAALRHLGTGTQEDLRDRLGGLTIPVLIVVGELDVPFARRGAEMVDAMGPNASLAVVAGAGHAVHLEAPDRTAEVVTGWLGGLTGS